MIRMKTIAVLINSAVEAAIPEHIKAANIDDDGKPTLGMWNKVYQNDSMWAVDLDRKVPTKAGAMFANKGQRPKVIREYVIQKGICEKKVKNDKPRHTVVCKGKYCEFRVYTSRLRDGVTWQVKTLRNVGNIQQI